MNKFVLIIAIIILAVAGYYIFTLGGQSPVVDQGEESQTTENGQQGEQTMGEEESGQVAQPTTHSVVYTDEGYLPSEVIIKQGDSVVFKNQSNAGMWTASAMHPTHTVYSGTSLQEHCQDSQNDAFDACKNYQKGEEWSFTFNKQGTWGYHNHLMPSHFGKVTVE